MSPPNVTAFLLYFFFFSIIIFSRMHVLKVTRVLSVALISGAKVKVGQELFAFTEALNVSYYKNCFLSFRLTEC